MSSEKVIHVTDAEIEEKISRWSEDKGEDGERAPAGKTTTTTRPPTKFEPRKERVIENRRPKRQVKKDKPTRKVICTFCGNQAEINFEPDPNKPVYCKNCLDLSKQGKIPSPNSIKVVKKEIANTSKPKKEEFVSLSEALKMSPNKFSPEEKTNKKPVETKQDSEKNVLNPGQVIKF